MLAILADLGACPMKLGREVPTETSPNGTPAAAAVVSG